MSRKGNVLDNAPMESFFATLKKELIHRDQYQTRRVASSRIFEYIQGLLQSDPYSLGDRLLLAGQL
ncbi:MAG: IS3 family transposase [Candidatus Promineifilaceae bacterium]